MFPSNLCCIFTACLPSVRSRGVAPFRLLCIVALVIAACGPVGAVSNRRTTDWQADLISVLMERQMHAAAASICERHFSEAEPRSDAAARWAVRWSMVLASEILRSDSVTEDEVEAAKEPVVRLLQSYREHDRQLWLRAQAAMVDLSAARHAAVAYAVAAHRNDLQSIGLERISSTLGQLDDLEASLKTELSRVASAVGETAVTSGELIMLQQNVGKQRVAAYLLRSRFFPEHSDDAIASATRAVAAAEAVLARLQSNASLRPEVLLLKAEAVYRSGDPAQAAKLLDDLKQSLQGELPPEALALQVRIALEQTPAQAAEILASYYGSDPEAAPASTEMDAARLRWLLEKSDSQEPDTRDQVTADVADWLDTMERRGGVYARRRGEAEALQRMRIAPDSSDVRLLAAEAAKRLREGEASAAAALLVQAAKSAQQPDQAITYAQQAAAAYLRVEEPSPASAILVQTAQAYPEEPTAAKAHLQAALLTSRMLKKTGETDVEPLIEMLKRHATLWPRDATTEKTLPWLLSIFDASRRHAEAARFLMNQASPSAADIDRAGAFWRTALRAIDDSHEQQPVVDEAIVLLTRDREGLQEVRSVADWQAVSIAALFGTRSQLQSVRSRFPDSPEEAATADELFRFVQSLVRFRLEGRPASTLETGHLSEHLQAIVDAIERLRAEGKDRPRDRQRAGAAMMGLLEILRTSNRADDLDASLDPFIKSIAQVWTGQSKEAASEIKSIVSEASSEEKSEAIQKAATILSDSDSAEGQREAISYWKRLAQGLPQGSPRWHQAKLALARLLIDLGEIAEAKQVCQFVLITRPPEDPVVRADYEEILQR